MRIFGENIKSVRVFNNLSQKHLADLMGITQQCISEWECGKVEPSLQNLIKLIKVLKSSFEELTDGIAE